MSDNAAGRCQAGRPGRLLEATRKRCPRVMAVRYRLPQVGGALQNPAYRLADVVKMRGSARHAGPLANFAAPAGIRQKNRCVVRSDFCMRPAHRVFDFASADSEIAEHVVIQAREFRNGLASSQFGFDCSFYPGQEFKNSSNEELCDQTRSPPPSLEADAVDFVERSSRMHFHYPVLLLPWCGRCRLRAPPTAGLRSRWLNVKLSRSK